MKIKLTHSTILKMRNQFSADFKYYPRTDIIALTDNVLFPSFKKVIYETGNTQPLTMEDFYSTLDAYKDLQETYQTLVYHQELYRKGKTPLDAFIGVCDGLSADELRLL